MWINSQFSTHFLTFTKEDFNKNLYFCVMNGQLFLQEMSKFIYRNSPPEEFFRKGVLKRNFNEITLRYGCSPVNSLRIFRTFFLRTPLKGCFCIYNNTKVIFSNPCNAPKKNLSKVPEYHRKIKNIKWIPFLKLFGTMKRHVVIH